MHTFNKVSAISTKLASSHLEANIQRKTVFLWEEGWRWEDLPPPLWFPATRPGTWLSVSSAFGAGCAPAGREATAAGGREGEGLPAFLSVLSTPGTLVTSLGTQWSLKPTDGFNTHGTCSAP